MKFKLLNVAQAASLLLLSGCSDNPVEFNMASFASMSSVCTDLTADAVRPKLKWDWYTQLDKTKAENYPTYNQVMASPVVGDLNGDRLPEVVFVTFTSSAYNSKGVLRIVDGATGITIRSVGDDEAAPTGATAPLLIDIDRDGKVEIFYLHHLGTSIVALNYDGSKRWIYSFGGTLQRTYQGFSAVDTDKNGIAEIVVGSWSITEDSSKNPIKSWQIGSSTVIGSSYALSLNINKPDEISFVTQNGVYDITGKAVFSMSTGSYATGDIDGVPGLELVGVSGDVLRVYDGQTGQIKHQNNLGVYAETKCSKPGVGGGPITLGDFDGNSNTIEIAMASSTFLAIFNNDGTLYAKYSTQDCSSKATGISSFDFNGDGTPEILYGDEEYFRIFELKDGQLRVIWSTVNPSGTLNEYPLVADIDGNRTSEIVVVANSYPVAGFYNDIGEAEDKEIAKNVTGVRAFEATQQTAWMPTRSLWNSFNYNPAFVTDNLQAVSSTPVDTFTARLFRRNVPMGKFEPKCRVE